MKKIIVIFVLMLLIATSYPVFSIEINNAVISNKDSPGNLPIPWKGVDQKQDKHCGYGMWVQPPYLHAQEFKPSKEKLIGVELWMFKYGNPPLGLQITVSIRDSLNGNDLTIATVSADQITKKTIWVLFDFDDINVTIEKTYYIVCRGGGGNSTNVYCWLFNANNSYDRGIAWESVNNGVTWTDLENWDPDVPQIDFCFKTYNSKPRIKTFNFDQLSWLFERFSNLFPVLEKIIQKLG